MKHHGIFAMVLALLLLWPGSTYGADPAAEKAQADSPAAKESKDAREAKSAPASPEDKATAKTTAKARAETPPQPLPEAEVLKFVQENHPELKELLESLRDNRRADYDKAIRDLYRDSSRLAQLKDRAPKQYEPELKAWKIKSRIQLLAARLAMDASDEIKSQLKSLLNEQIDLRAVLLKQEQARLQEQLSRTDRNLTQMEADRQATVDSQLQRIIKSAAAQAKKVAAKPNKTPSKTAP